jgi:hypothetical protein
MKMIYDIKIKGYGLERIYKDAETEFHDEFYVDSIYEFYKELIKIGKADIANSKDFERNIECTYTKRPRFPNENKIDFNL